MLQNLTLEINTGIGAQLSDKFGVFFTDLQKNSGDYVWAVLEVIFIWVAAKFVLRIVSYFTSRMMKSERYHKAESQGKRVDTVMTVLRSTARYLVYFVAVFLMFPVLGIKTESLVVTAGVTAAAIGFGAQSLVKDVVTGFFLMFENQFSVGDYVKIDEFEGTVEAMALRVTYIKTAAGEKIILPNGTISRVVNYSRSSSRAKVVVPVSYKYDIKSVLGELEYAVKVFAAENPDILMDFPVIQGITAFETNRLEITVVCNTKSLSHWSAERKLRLVIYERFCAAGIEFPYSYVISSGSETPLAAPDDGEVKLPPSVEIPKETRNDETFY